MARPHSSGIRHGLSKVKTGSPVCSSCHSNWIYERKGNGFSCRMCGHFMNQPAILEPKVKTKGSGVVAPLSYRQQIAREMLLNNAIKINCKTTYFGKT